MSYILTFSQISNGDVSFELRYPKPVGDNFLSNYTGIIDAGIDYSANNSKKFTIGATFNSSFLNGEFPFADVKLLILSPKFKLQYKINLKNSAIVSNVALGYSNFKFFETYNFTDVNANPIGPSTAIKNENGISLKASSKIVFNYSKRWSWFIQLSYEFTRLAKPMAAMDVSYNRNVHLIYPGVGITFRFKK